jgi:hypothetical protein
MVDLWDIDDEFSRLCDEIVGVAGGADAYAHHRRFRIHYANPGQGNDVFATVEIA